LHKEEGNRSKWDMVFHFVVNNMHKEGIPYILMMTPVHKEAHEWQRVAQTAGLLGMTFATIVPWECGS
jgi:hypothetical protein